LSCSGRSAPGTNPHGAGASPPSPPGAAAWVTVRGTQMTAPAPTSPRERVRTALRHEEPDRVPVDFLATPEVWAALIAHLGLDGAGIGPADLIEPAREQLLRRFEVDTRVISYDMFCNPPEAVLRPGAAVDWWGSLDRSTPNRMWRQRQPDGTNHDVWGAHRVKVLNQFSAYEDFASWPLQRAESVADLRGHAWPEPDWWDFSPLPGLLAALDEHEQYHLRFRIGSVFEVAWQLRGMQEFLIDLATQPEIPGYIMGRLADVYVENTRRVLELAGDRLDMVYFYDDVATQNSLLISPDTWRTAVRPHHARLVELAHSYGVPVMYHCDGAIYRLIPELIELGIDVLNPIQPDARDMDGYRLKEEFGDRLSFHGGIDIIKTLPRGTREEVIAEVRDRVNVLGRGGGYILCSSHHIQADTPLANVLAMVEPSLRYRDAD
jgi:uroporphyrinogen decarboxylase